MYFSSDFLLFSGVSLIVINSGSNIHKLEKKIEDMKVIIEKLDNSHTSDFLRRKEKIISYNNVNLTV